MQCSLFVKAHFLKALHLLTPLAMDETDVRYLSEVLTDARAKDRVDVEPQHAGSGGSGISP